MTEREMQELWDRIPSGNLGTMNVPAWLMPYIELDERGVFKRLKREELYAVTGDPMFKPFPQDKE